ncbi:MAG TPA: sigma-70 family RNA polymerase sigma factor [Urbifossiella sp.]|nr:sigma-70 family RNA polymerase sigma factor [Urbifossiella sp.]
MTGPRPADILRHLAVEPMPDADLLRRFATTRDGAAFAELVRRHGPFVLAACRRGVRHHHDADDAFQAVFLVLARRAGAIQRPELLGNWLYRVAVMVARNARRAVARRRAREVQVVDVPEPAVPAPPPQDDFGPVVDEELDGLQAWYRDALILCDLHGVSRADAAAQLGIPLGTLASRLDTGRKKLAARLVRRGVTLSVGAVSVEARAVAVPEGLFKKTCVLAADWAAGGVLPAAVLRLARGGLTMKVVLLGGALAAALATGATLALGGSEPPPPSPPSAQNPPAVVAAATASPQPAPAAEPPVKLGLPRLTRTTNLPLRTVSGVAWSRDGAWLAAVGTDTSNLQDTSAIVLVVVASNDPKATPGKLPLPAQSGLIGFTTDGTAVLAATRETGLVNSEHLLHRVKVSVGDANGAGRPISLVRDGDDPEAVVDGAEQLTPAGPQEVRFLIRAGGRVSVWRAGLKFEGQRPLGGFDGTFSELRLTPDGGRVVALAGKGVVEGYDAATGKRLWATEPAAKLPEVKLAPRGVASGEDRIPSVGLVVGLSQNGRRAVVARGPQTPVLALDLDTGKGLPLPANLGPVVPTGPVAMSGDGTLAALAYTSLVPVDGKAKGGGPKFEAATHAYGPTQLTVWDTATGSVVRTWPRPVAALAFHPSRPVLAVLEAYGGSWTRLGLWDFAAQP